MNRLRPILGGLSLAVVALLLTIGFAEIVLRYALPSPKEYRMLLPGTSVFQPDSRYVHGISGPARYVVNRHGIRGRDFGPDATEYRVLLVGGSTTECGMLDEEENWGAIAERALDRTADGRAVWFGNVGRSGLTSRDHIVTLRYLLPQYPRMDLIIVLVGVNDLTAALRQGDSYRSPQPLSDPNAERIQIRNAFALSPAGFREMLTSDLVPTKTPWYKETRLFQLAKRARTAWQARNIASGIGGALLGQWRANRQSASQIIDSLPDLSKPLADYRSSLLEIVREADRGGVDVMFMTQPSLWGANLAPAEERKLWLGGTGAFQEEPGHAYYAASALAKAMRLYNEVTLEVCVERRLSCLDLASHMPADTTMFYDDVHFTEAGAARVGMLVAAHLRATNPDLQRSNRRGSLSR